MSTFVTFQDLPVHAESGGPGPSPTAPIFFIFLSIFIGATVQHFQDKFHSNLPYTVVLLVLGFAFGTIGGDMKRWPPEMAESFTQWSRIDGHLFLFLFLPALLFGDAMGLNWHMVKRCLGQCILLAGPGVLVGAILAATIPYFFFGPGWNIPRSLMFGTVLAATDPVAVVGIMKSLGASPKLTMIISGESLMNDGVAIVVFLFFMNLAKKSSSFLSDEPGIYKQDLTDVPELDDFGGLAWYATRFFFIIAICGAAFGWFMGLLFFYRIQAAMKRSSHTAPIVQVALTLACAYLTFFIGEGVLGVSGVLATVVAAVVVGSAGWSAFVDREFMGEFWHMTEWLMNTLLFFLCGFLMGRKWWDHAHEEGVTREEAWVLIPRLFFLYAMLTLIRFAIVLLFLPLLSRMGYGFNYKEGMVLGWGGLRGAVGLALAIDIVSQFYLIPCPDGVPADPHVYAAAAASGTASGPGSGSGPHGLPPNECGELKWFADQCFFYICGFAFLTLLINGTTAGKVLSYLGMLVAEEHADVLKNAAKLGMKRELRKEFEKTVPNLYAKKFSDEMKLKVEENCAMLLGATHERQAGGVVKAIQSSATGGPRRSMVGRIKTNATSGEAKVADATSGTDSQPGAPPVGESEMLDMASVESNLSWTPQFWGEGKSREKAISLLYLRTLRSEYLELSAMGLMPVSAGTLLTESVDSVIELVKAEKVRPDYLGDLRIIMKGLDTEWRGCGMLQFLKCVARCHPKALVGEEMVFNHEADIVTKKEARLDRITTLLCYIIAHRAAEFKLANLLDKDLMDSATILASSKKKTRDCVKILELEGIDAVEVAKVHQVCCLVWEKERQLINEYQESGLLDGSQAHHLLEDVEFEASFVPDLPEPPEEGQMTSQATALI